MARKSVLFEHMLLGRFSSWIRSGLGVLRAHWILCTILLSAFLVRIVGIGYGLPLWVVADEPPFTLGALQMIQLKTLLPVLHPEAFKILYYAPYLSYLYLAPFIAIVTVKYVVWHSTAALFINTLLTDLSPFFLTARTLSVLFGIGSIFLMYKVGESLFSKTAGLATSLLMATSITHQGISMIARHWMPTCFFFALVLFFLTRNTLRENRKYLYALLAVGVGMGFDTTAGLGLIPIAGYWLFMSEEPRFFVFTDKLVWLGGVLFVALAALPTVLHPLGNGFLHDVTLTHAKDWGHLLMSPIEALSFVTLSEPVLIGFALIGICMLAVHVPRKAGWFLFWFLLYTGTFAFMFRLEPRFFVPLISLYALLGGYAVAVVALRWRTSLPSLLALLLLLIPMIASVRLAVLAYRGDTRELARTWTEQHLTPSDKILVYASLTRLPTQAEAVQELRGIDVSALRKADGADEALARTNLPYALNLSTVASSTFMKELPGYAKKHKYTYVLYEPGYAADPESATAFAKLTGSTSPLITFTGTDGFSVADSIFTGPLRTLFTGTNLGPTVSVYSLQ